MKKLEPKKGHVSLYLTFIIFFVAAMFFVKKCSSPVGTVTDMRAGGDTINVAIEMTPTGVYSSGDSLAGFNYELVKEIANMMGRPVRISAFTSPESALRALDSGRYDVVLGNLPVTSRLREKYQFTEPLYVDRQILVRRKSVDGDSTAVVTQNDLAGDTVWIVAGSPYLDRLRNLSNEIGDTIYVMEDPEYGAEQLIIMTALGEIKQAVVNEETARRIAAEYNQLDFSTSISFNQFHSWIMSPRDSTLRVELDSVINRFKITDRYKELCDKYLK